MTQCVSLLIPLALLIAQSLVEHEDRAVPYYIHLALIALMRKYSLNSPTISAGVQNKFCCHGIEDCQSQYCSSAEKPLRIIKGSHHALVEMIL